MRWFWILLALPLLSSAFIKGELSQEERARKLRPFFNPPPGDLASIDPEEHRNFLRKKDPWLFRGRIVVTPPKGVCFTIERSKELPDEIVCKQTYLTFSVSDLTENGELTWKVTTGEGDFGSYLKWKTPHRLARVIGEGKAFDSELEHLPVNRCEAVELLDQGRRIYVHLMDGRVWTIRLPEKDVPLEQPKQMPKLFIDSEMSLGNQEDSVIGKRTGRGAGSSKDKDAASEFWRMPRRDSFSMNAANFMTGDSSPPGMEGECRYQLKPENNKEPWIECHHSSLYELIILPLPCAKDLDYK